MANKNRRKPGFHARKPMDAKRAEQALLEVADLLDDLPQKPTWFLVQGTALGAYRDNGFCPSDVDIDIGMVWKEFHRSLPGLVHWLTVAGYDIRTASYPFTKPRILVAISPHGIKVDIVSYVPWNGRYFCHNTDRKAACGPYAVVYPKARFDSLDQVPCFGRDFYVPAPIEQYLEEEYGDWAERRDGDHESKTRVYNFIKQEEVPRDWLDQL